MKSKKKKTQQPLSDQPAGRPPKYNDPVVLDALFKSLFEGASIKASCNSAGIDRSTITKWCNQAKAGNEKYFKFFNGYKKARADLEISLVNDIRTAAKTQWQAAAWLLERLMPKRYGRRNVIDLNAQNKVTVDDPQKIVNSLSPQQLAQLLSAIEAKTLELAASQNSEPQVKD
jgi:hypothetical protein